MTQNKLNRLWEKAPVSSQLANLRADIKASRRPSDKDGKMIRIDNNINKIVHMIKTKGNTPKLQRALRKAKLLKFKIQKQNMDK